MKPVQLTSRLTARWHRPPAEWPEASRYRLVQRHPSLPAAAPARVSATSFRFLNETRHFEGPDPWTPHGVPRLWRHQLHGFRWMWELSAARAAELAAHWLDHQPALAGAGWEPYPLSLRVREWIEWLLAHPDAPPGLRERMLASVAHQVRVLEDRIEYPLQGERLLENAITLCWAGLSLEGPSSLRWVLKGRRLLAQQLERQILHDGTHETRSPMLQAQLAEALLRLSEAAGPTALAHHVRESARAAGEEFVEALRALTHPDGEIALLGDAALGEAPNVRTLEERFAIAPASSDEANAGPRSPAPADALWSLPQGGYFGVREGHCYLVLDAGPLGPDHQPAHGHADALSFELSYEGRRLFTDTGVYGYERGPRRDVDRGTAAHNTVQVDGLDQSELYGAHACGRRIRRASGQARIERGVPLLAGGYLGVARKARLQHVRECRWEAPWLRFTERLAASGAHEAMLRLHVAPGLVVAPSPDGPRLLDSGLPLALVHGEGFEWTVGESPYHPEFGKELVRPSLFARTGFADQVTLEWAIRLL